MGRPVQDLLEAFQELELGRGAEFRWRPGIEVDRVVESITLVDGSLAGLERERGHVSPLGTEERRIAVDLGVARLIDEVVEGERLPALRELETVGAGGDGSATS